MLQRLSIFLLFSLLISCTNGDYQKPDDPLEAGSDFIRFALDGNMSNANLFILKDADNERLFSEWQKKIESYSKEERSEYKGASIRINKFEKIDDTTTIINYSNSYKNEDHDLKMVKQNGEWWVDFKYTFVGKPITE